MDRTRDRERALICAALDRLPLPLREVYRLSAVEGLDQRAIAERFGIDVSEVEGLLAEAIVRIGWQLGAHCPLHR